MSTTSRPPDSAEPLVAASSSRHPNPRLHYVYLLRSAVRPAALYIGSTPDPPRRLRQHNGEQPGGAARTASPRLRPWRAVCVVSGFLGSRAALQFERAWQHPENTRHIPLLPPVPPKQRAARQQPGPPAEAPDVASAPPPTRRKAGVSLRARLFYLHLLLRAPAFARSPLTVRFLVPDIGPVWRDLGRVSLLNLPDAVQVPTADADLLSLGPGDPFYSAESAIQSQKRAADTTPPLCSVCNRHDPDRPEPLLFCPDSACPAGAHLLCLGRTFVAAERAADSGQIHVLPKGGCCVGCGTYYSWAQFVREFALSQYAALAPSKKNRRRKGAARDADGLDPNDTDDTDNTDDYGNDNHYDSDHHGHLAGSDFDSDSELPPTVFGPAGE